MADPRDQFGPAAERYLTSGAHANEAALARCVELAQPRGGAVLDVGTGAGHLAYAFAPHARKVVALDPTPEMLQVTARTATERGLDQIETLLGFAEELNFEDGAFEGVASRIAAHHFQSVPKFLAEAWRVTESGGWLLIVDTIGIEDPAANEELQLVETLRDPSHVRNYTETEWRAMTEKAGYKIVHVETHSNPHNAYDWLDRMSVQEPVRTRTLHSIIYSEGWLRDYLRPTGEGETLTFRLHQIALLAARP
ncbi:MAG: class I SAM-dependent methyltransferase [Chthonomonas sp.]|nr:class I SAM-dependent methyltransferase [Chthonomonas sp.]